MRRFYFVKNTKTNEVLGFNLTEGKKNKLFYNVDIGVGSKFKSSRDRAYGSTDYKAKSLKDFENLMKIRNHFKNCTEYSYIIFAENGQWLDMVKNITEAQLMESIKKVKTNYPNAGELFIIETIGNSITV